LYIFLVIMLYLLTITLPIYAEVDHPSKTLSAIRINEQIKIDGYLSEDIWKSNGITEFVSA